MSTIDPRSLPSDVARGSTAVVVAVAATERAGRRAAVHASRLFGQEHRHLAFVVADPVSVVADVIRRRDVAAVVIGVDLDDEGRRAGSRALRLVRSSPCPVILVAV